MNEEQEGDRERRSGREFIPRSVNEVVITSNVPEVTIGILPSDVASQKPISFEFFLFV